MGEDSSSVVDKFFTRLYAVDDLREHILVEFWLLLDLSWLPDEIGDSDFKSQHAVYEESCARSTIENAFGVESVGMDDATRTSAGAVCDETASLK